MNMLLKHPVTRCQGFSCQEAEEVWLCLRSSKINSVICSPSAKINNMEAIFHLFFLSFQRCPVLHLLRHYEKVMRDMKRLSIGEFIVPLFIVGFKASIHTPCKIEIPFLSYSKEFACSSNSCNYVPTSVFLLPA